MALRSRLKSYGVTLTTLIVGSATTGLQIMAVSYGVVSPAVQKNKKGIITNWPWLCVDPLVISHPGDEDVGT